MVELHDGCICCTLRGDLIKSVKELSQSEAKFDYLVIESTGIAEPMPVAQTFTMNVNECVTDECFTEPNDNHEHHDPLSNYAFLDGLVTVCSFLFRVRVCACVCACMQAYVCVCARAYLYRLVVSRCNWGEGVRPHVGHATYGWVRVRMALGQTLVTNVSNSSLRGGGGVASDRELDHPPRGAQGNAPAGTRLQVDEEREAAMMLRWGRPSGHLTSNIPWWVLPAAWGGQAVAMIGRMYSSSNSCVCVCVFVCVCVYHHRIGKETEKRQGVHALYTLSLRSMEGRFIRDAPC